MAPHHVLSRMFKATAGILMLSALLVGCTGGGGQPAVVLTGGPVGFDRLQATTANDPTPRADQRFACGSRDLSFGEELVTLDNPGLAKVQNQWADVVPGKAVFMTGKVSHIEGADTGLREGDDLPLTHPFGTDITFNAVLDGPFASLAQKVGAEVNDIAAGTLHTELEKGQIPHSDSTTYLSGFLPQDGDRVAAAGRWIIDCGHSDFHTEMHPPSFISFGHTEGSATVSHAFYYPYEVTEVYNPDPSMAAEVGNTQRFTDPGSKTLPGFFVDELLRIIKGDHDRLQVHILVKAHDVKPMTWYVCAPGPRPAGAQITTSYQFTARPGIDIRATREDGLGCVRFDLTVGAAYQPAIPTRLDCRIPWTNLNEQLQGALMNPDLDILKLIESKVGADLAPVVERDPVFDCYDPFVVGPPGPSGGATGIVTSSDQPYPFYGQARVSWSS